MNIFRQLIFFLSLFFFFFFFFWFGFKIRKKIRSRLDPVTFYDIIVEPAYGERDIVVTISVRACVRPDLSGRSHLHLCMNFTIIWHRYSPRAAEVPFETFVRVG